MATKLKIIFHDDDESFNREKWSHLDVETPYVWWLPCFSDDDLMSKLETAQNLPGVETVEVVYD